MLIAGAGTAAGPILPGRQAAGMGDLQRARYRFRDQTSLLEILAHVTRSSTTARSQCHSHHRPPLPRLSAPAGAIHCPGIPALFHRERRRDDAAHHVPHTVFYRWAIKELARFHGCEPTAEAVLAARAAVEPNALARRMLADANIPLLLLDYGFQGPENLTWQEMATRRGAHRAHAAAGGAGARADPAA